MPPKIPVLKVFGLIAIISLIGFVIITIEREKTILRQDQIISQSKKVGASSKKPKTWDQVCVNCHSIQGEGGDIGPALDSVTQKYKREYLINWLKDPGKIKHGSLMPNFELTDKELNEIVTFLFQVRGESI